MALAFSDGEIETQLRRLDADLSRKPHRSNLIEEPEIVIAHRHRSRSTRDRFAELREDQPATARSDGGTRYECVISVLARHELPRRPLHKFAAQSEVVEPRASRCGEQNRTSQGHGRDSSLGGESLANSYSAGARERTPLLWLARSIAERSHGVRRVSGLVTISLTTPC